jgi:tetraacyldisaccharide 4'-kinase
VTPLSALVSRSWYAPHPTPLSVVLTPFAWLFGALAALRRVAYRRGLLRRHRVPVPVVVVGNITVGGAGKTPLVATLVEQLRARGRRPGIVSRGYGRRRDDVRAVRAGDDAADVGDEPLVLVASGAPVHVGRDRPAAALALLAAHPDVDVIVADDGLQHYALARDVEIAVVDATRGLGNRMLLPAGPLREPPSRLATVDAVVTLLAGAASGDTVVAPREFAMTQQPQPWRNLVDPSRAFDPRLLRDPAAVAIAGIAHPDRFFDALRTQGFAGATQRFADHHRYSRADVAFADAPAILMTEKDAVKCRAFADARMWMQPIRAKVDAALIDVVVRKLDGFQAARNAGVPGDQGAADPRSRAR